MTSVGQQPRQPSFLLWNGVASLFVLPLSILVVQSVAQRWFFPQVIPLEWQLNAPAELLGRPTVRSAIWNSLAIATLTALFSLLVGLPAAWYLAARRARFRAVFIGLLLAPQVLPPLTAGMGLSIAFLRVGFSGGVPSVVLAHMVPVLPFVVGAAALTFSRLDLGYVAVASGLGLTPGQRWRQVVWPLSRVGVGLAAYVGFVISWSQYLVTLFVGGGRVITLPMLVLSSGSGSNLSLFAALALVMSIVPMGLFFFVRRGQVGV